ncbi:MAG: acetate--CoA ligase family protein [Anaerolineales bacterium]|nr:acetate--CoA ligase family protein [Anaerolineales bacterium]
MTDTSLIPFFSPKGVAIIGASLDPTKLGFGLSRNLVQSNYRGAIHFVNIKGGNLLGHPVHTSIMEVPEPVDLAVLLIPAEAIPQALQDCGRRGINAAIIASGGFRETGSEGAALESKCLEIAQKYRIRLLGPNCIGLIDTHLPLDTTFLSPPGPTPGDVAFISHSGAICAAVIDWARGQGFGLSRLVSLGNQVDINETDMLAQVAADPYTKVLTLYMEGVSNGRRFVEKAQEVTRSKPVIALKVGRFEGGKRAAASHTGALAGEESAYNAAFRRAGVIRAETSEELFEWARALAWCPLPKGRNVAVLTNSGGPGVTAADALESLGLRMASFQPSTQTALRALLPPAASADNPVDMLAAATPQQYANCLRILLADPGVDSVMVILPPPPMSTAGGTAKTMIPVIYTADKPVVVALMGERLIQEAVEHFRAARVPEYRFPEQAAAALAILTQRAEMLASGEKADESTKVQISQSQIDKVSSILDSITTVRKNNFLPTETVQALLDTYGIPTLPLALGKSPTEAADLAHQMGFPVALKLASNDITHKSDIGGVILHLQTPEEVQNGYNRIMRNAREAHPGAESNGVYIQHMLPEGQEVIIGTVQDSQFGSLLMFGSGGIEVEGLKDIAFSLAPLPKDEAEWMLNNTWAGKKLAGYRNIPPGDREAVVDVILRLAHLAADFPQLAEIEINPLLVFPIGQGVCALDVRAKLSNG